MTEAESNRVCEQGHPIRIGDEFCGQCGARAAGHRRRQTPDGIWQQQGEDGNWYPAEPPTAPRGLLAIERRTGQQVQVLIGLTGGIVGFAGFFVDFFSAGGTTLASASSGWFDLVPIFDWHRDGGIASSSVQNLFRSGPGQCRNRIWPKRSYLWFGGSLPPFTGSRVRSRILDGRHRFSSRGSGWACAVRGSVGFASSGRVIRSDYA